MEISSGKPLVWGTDNSPSRAGHCLKDTSIHKITHFSLTTTPGGYYYRWRKGRTYLWNLSKNRVVPLSTPLLSVVSVPQGHPRCRNKPSSFRPVLRGLVVAQTFVITPMSFTSLVSSIRHFSILHHPKKGKYSTTKWPERKSLHSPNFYYSILW